MQAEKTRHFWIPVLAGALLTGCGGAKVLKEPQPLPEEIGPVASATATDVDAQIDWVIVRDGPGTWSRNADWDEYVMRVRNTGTAPLTITAVSIEDSLGNERTALADRKALVRASKETARLYGDEGIEVKAGMGAGTIVVTGAAAGAAGLTLGAATLYSSGAAAATALGAILAAPVIIGGGAIRYRNSSRVHKEIVRRHTEMPVSLASGESRDVDVFFPITPSPRQVVLAYEMDGREHELVIDTSAALDGLHLSVAD